MLSLYKTKINFLSNKSIVFSKSNVYINLNEEDDWQKLENNSVGSYEFILIRIIDFAKREVKQLFLKNANIIFKNDLLEINTLSEPVFYLSTEQKIKDKNQISTLKKQLEFYKAKQKIGLEIDEFLDYKKTKENYYQEKMIKLLNLERED